MGNNLSKILIKSSDAWIAYSNNQLPTVLFWRGKKLRKHLNSLITFIIIFC